MRFSWPKSFLFFFEGDSFLIPKNAPDLDVPVEFDIFFFQSKYVRGDEDEDLDAKGVPTVPYPLAYPSKLRNMNGKYRKILMSFYRGPVTTPPGHSDFCKDITSLLSAVSLSSSCVRRVSGAALPPDVLEEEDFEKSWTPRSHTDRGDGITTVSQMGGNFFRLHLEGCFLGE